MRKKSVSQKPCESSVYWIVGAGDTLWLISRRLGVSVERIIAANPGIEPRNLRIGSKICIPF